MGHRLLLSPCLLCLLSLLWDILLLAPPSSSICLLTAYINFPDSAFCCILLTCFCPTSLLPSLSCICFVSEERGGRRMGLCNHPLPRHACSLVETILNRPSHLPPTRRPSSTPHPFSFMASACHLPPSIFCTEDGTGRRLGQTVVCQAGVLL